VAITIDKDYVVENIAPHLESIPEGRFSVIIDVAKQSVAEDIWGDKSDYAAAVLTAHILTFLTRGGAAGVSGEVKRKKIGDSEIEFATTMAGKYIEGHHELNTTSYGKEFLRLRRSLVLTPRVSSCQV
jgi:hypothetical protein